MPIGCQWLFASISLVVLVWASQVRAAAEEAFYRVPLADLKITEGNFPSDDSDHMYRRRNWQRRDAMSPRVVLDGDEEGYIAFEGDTAWWGDIEQLRDEAAIVVRGTKDRDLAGSLYLPKNDFSGMVKLRFSIPASDAGKESQAFYRGKEQHYARLLGRRIPGAAWFRHQKLSAYQALARSEQSLIDTDERNWERHPTDVADTFDLFSGGRVVRENLQLDRELRLLGKNDELVELATLKGITIAEIDWRPLLAEADPAVDSLARSIPADQHAVFFPSFSAAVALADEVARQGTPLSRLALSRSEDELVKEHYERQLCLPLSTLARLLGPTVIETVALTGSDPYFFTGTDVAVLFECKQPATLKGLLVGRAAVAAREQSDAKAVSGEIEGLAWSGFLTPDRRVSCYLAALDGSVIVTNSLAQLARLARVGHGDSPALATLDEYKFFRQRYVKGGQDETAFVFLSDATIRRWCGPKWRIAASRRLRYAAVMSELQARFLDDLVSGNVEEGPIHTDLPLAGIVQEATTTRLQPPKRAPGNGELRLGKHGVQSSSGGTLEFQTPIVELALDQVTKAEAEAYTRWRNTYQSNWRWAFDPIALQLTLNDERLAADLSVMPLIWGSDYRSLVEIARGAEIRPTSGDPHASLAHFVLAINRESEQMRPWMNLAQGVVRINPLDWIGDWVSLYVDDDPEFWKGLADVTGSDDAWRYTAAHLDRLPVGVHIAVRDPWKLTAFLAGVRAYGEQTAPKMTLWESLTYKDEPYVRVGPSERARGTLPPEIGQPKLFYSFSSDGLILTFNEDLLKRALDRQIARRKAKEEGKPLDADSRPWLGESVCFQFDREALNLVQTLGGENLQPVMQARSWGNLPILNEWRRRYPDRDPVKLHEEFWQTRLVSPGGGQYVWNDEWQTMESTVYGHPGEPKAGPKTLPFSEMTSGNFGITFEKQGLRARAVIDRRPGENRSP